MYLLKILRVKGLYTTTLQRPLGTSATLQILPLEIGFRIPNIWTFHQA